MVHRLQVDRLPGVRGARTSVPFGPAAFLPRCVHARPQETDESSIPEFIIPHFGEEPEAESIRYPFAGGNNAVVHIGVVASEGSNQVTWLDLGIDWVRRRPLPSDVVDKLTLHGSAVGLVSSTLQPQPCSTRDCAPTPPPAQYGSTGYRRFADGCARVLRRTHRAPVRRAGVTVAR